MKTIHPSRLLKAALLLDAGISGATGAVQMGLNAELSGLLRLPPALLLESGAVMVVWAALLMMLVRATEVASALIGAVVAGNVGWTLVCVGMAVSGTPTTNALGTGFLLLQAAITLTFACLQLRGLRLSPAASTAPATRPAGAN